jgi:RNA polymerase sigma-70 factor (ECF subfamily)
LAVYIAHRDELLTYANRFVKDPARAEDVVQEAWLRYAARSGKGEEIANTLTYLYSIVRNLAIDWVRRGRRETLEAPDSEMLLELPAETPSAENIMVHRDEFRALMEVIAELPERTQIAFRMCKLEERPLQDVATVLGVSVGRAHQMVRDGMVHASRRLFGDDD